LCGLSINSELLRDPAKVYNPCRKLLSQNPFDNIMMHGQLLHHFLLCAQSVVLNNLLHSISENVSKRPSGRGASLRVVPPSVNAFVDLSTVLRVITP
jgi:hypothetical protein